MKSGEGEVKPFAEPLSHEDLCEGHLYFFLNFLDEDLLVPVLKPVIFIGRDLEKGESGQVWFQDYESYSKGIRFGVPNASEGVFYSGQQEETGHVFEFQKALNLLIFCSLRRKGRD